MPARHVVRRLVEEIRSVEEAARRSDQRPRFSTGIRPLDALLPGGGLRRGMLIEWLPAGEEGGGASLLALLTARASAEGMRNEECGMRNEEEPSPNSAFRIPHSAFETLIVIDRHGTFYPPAAAVWGVPLSSLILLRPTNARDEAWALDQALRSPAVAAVLAWPHRLEGRAFRRLQLAAEASGAIGLLVRPAAARTEPTWADVRLKVGPLRRSGPGAPLDFTLSGEREERRHARGGDRDAPLDFTLGGERVPSGRSSSANWTYCRSGLEDRTSGWQLCIHRLHARSCVQQREEVYVEIVPDGRIQEVAPATHTPMFHSQSAI